MDRLAIFGGTFDPIHLGHINLAAGAVEECGLDRLLFMPNRISPFKTEKKVTPGEIRCQMIETVIHYNKAFGISRYEIEKEEPSYTYETLSYFRRLTDSKIYFILGFDSITQIDTWYRGPDILKEYSLIAGYRPKSDSEAGLIRIEEYSEKYDADIHVLNTEPFDASSTEIREAVAAGRDIDDFVPLEISEFIKKNGLYAK